MTAAERRNDPAPIERRVLMAKGKDRPSKEPKKPKKEKPKASATAGFGSRAATPPAKGGKS